MSSQAFVSNSTIHLENEIVRRSTNYHPSVWGDYFINYTLDIGAFNSSSQEVEDLKVEVRKIMKEVRSEPCAQMKLIEALQRLGVAYHFEMEIEDAIKQLYEVYSSVNINDLYTTALCFRLLRQHGYYVSCDVFAKFKDENGGFQSYLISDVKGLLSLYEASHLRVSEEEILEKALHFTTTHLTASLSSLSCSPLGRQVQHSLEQPLHKGMPRLEARSYISFYEENDQWSYNLTKLAKLDFNLVQSLHRKELSDVSKWWKNLDFASKLSFGRDRLIESYFWATGVCFEPSRSLSRMFLTKLIALAGIIDDIYDVYGTIEELQLFTNAIKRMDVAAINLLPEYMKVCYQALLDVYDEIEETMSKKGRSFHVYYAKEGMKDFIRAYFTEAIWLSKKYVPKVEEYMRNALVSSGYYMLTAASFVAMENISSNEAFEWVRSDPKLLRASTIICRLMNDLVSHKLERDKGDVASAVECFVEEYNVKEQEAYNELNKMVEQAWKDLNEESMVRTNKSIISMPLVMCVINLTRMIYVIYKHEDGFSCSNTRLKEHITSLFIDPV